ncbi:MAG: ATP phosphoribosyltransferase regulatory subunit, partial [candidate division Zixibacteria bacterium]|nr:ATP phosphoribosyltransferase regulatory subunit [candidate division Zixibacteria bacterium]
MAKVGLPSGTRDFLPEQLIFRQKVIGIMKEVFERYGFLPLETPAVERLDVLSGKYGEEADRLIFKVLKRGEELKSALAKGEELADMGLRYDLTVPLCRVIAMHQNEISFPFRRYQIQPVWRADKPQKGRYREFYQCDVDIVGQEAPLADAELVAMTYEVLTALGFSNFSIRVNHRQILSALAEWAGFARKGQAGFFSALDKLDKVGL